MVRSGEMSSASFAVEIRSQLQKADSTMISSDASQRTQAP
eukprot:COSAG02_NODE_37420_length_442_cov_0.897959_2_plen_39_part_01